MNARRGEKEEEEEGGNVKKKCVNIIQIWQINDAINSIHVCGWYIFFVNLVEY